MPDRPNNSMQRAVNRLQRGLINRYSGGDETDNSSSTSPDNSSSSSAEESGVIDSISDAAGDVTDTVEDVEEKNSTSGSQPSDPDSKTDGTDGGQPPSNNSGTPSDTPADSVTDGNFGVVEDPTPETPQGSPPGPDKGPSPEEADTQSTPDFETPENVPDGVGSPQTPDTSTKDTSTESGQKDGNQTDSTATDGQQTDSTPSPTKNTSGTDTPTNDSGTDTTESDTSSDSGTDGTKTTSGPTDSTDGSQTGQQNGFNIIAPSNDNARIGGSFQGDIPKKYLKEIQQGIADNRQLYTVKRGNEVLAISATNQGAVQSLLSTNAEINVVNSTPWLDDSSDVNVDNGNVELTESGQEDKRQFRKKKAANTFDEQYPGVDVSTEDVVLGSDGPTVDLQTKRAIIAAQQGVDVSGVTFTGDGFQIDRSGLEGKSTTFTGKEAFEAKQADGTTLAQKAANRLGVSASAIKFSQTEDGVKATVNYTSQPDKVATSLDGGVLTFDNEMPGTNGTSTGDLKVTDAPTETEVSLSTDTEGIRINQNEGVRATIDKFTTGGLLAETGDSGTVLTDITGISEQDLSAASQQYSEASQFVGDQVGGAVDTVVRPITGEEDTTAGNYIGGGVKSIGEIGNVPAWAKAGETGVEITEETVTQAGKVVNPNDQADVSFDETVQAGSQVTNTAREGLSSQIRNNPAGLAGQITGGAIVSVGGGFALGKATRFTRQRVRTAGSDTFDIESGEIVNRETGQVYNPNADAPDEALTSTQGGRFPGAQDEALYTRDPAQAVRTQAEDFTPEAVEARYQEAGVTEGTTLKKALDVEPDGPGSRRAAGGFETQEGSYESPGGFAGPELSPNFLGDVNQRSSLSLRPGLPDTGDSSTGVLVRTQVENPDADTMDEFNQELLDREGETTARTKPASEVNPDEAEAVIPPEAEFADIGNRGVIGETARRAGIGSDFSARFGGYRVPGTDRKIGGKKVPLRPVSDPDLIESQGVRGRFRDFLDDDRAQVGARPDTDTSPETRTLGEIREPMRPATDRPLPVAPTPSGTSPTGTSDPSGPTSPSGTSSSLPSSLTGSSSQPSSSSLDIGELSPAEYSYSEPAYSPPSGSLLSGGPPTAIPNRPGVPTDSSYTPPSTTTTTTTSTGVPGPGSGTPPQQNPPRTQTTEFDLGDLDDDLTDADSVITDETFSTGVASVEELEEDLQF